MPTRSPSRRAGGELGPAAGPAGIAQDQPVDPKPPEQRHLAGHRKRRGAAQEPATGQWKRIVMLRQLPGEHIGLAQRGKARQPFAAGGQKHPRTARQVTRRRGLVAQPDPAVAPAWPPGRPLQPQQIDAQRPGHPVGAERALPIVGMAGVDDQPDPGRDPRGQRRLPQRFGQQRDRPAMRPPLRAGQHHSGPSAQAGGQRPRLGRAADQQNVSARSMHVASALPGPRIGRFAGRGQALCPWRPVRAIIPPGAAIRERTAAFPRSRRAPRHRCSCPPERRPTRHGQDRRSASVPWPACRRLPARWCG